MAAEEPRRCGERGTEMSGRFSAAPRWASANHFGLDLADTLRVVGRSPGASYISANWQFLAEVIKSHNLENIHKDLRALISRGIEGDLETPVAAAAIYSLRHDWPVADGAVAVAG